MIFFNNYRNTMSSQKIREGTHKKNVSRETSLRFSNTFPRILNSCIPHRFICEHRRNLRTKTEGAGAKESFLPKRPSRPLRPLREASPLTFPVPKGFRECQMPLLMFRFSGHMELRHDKNCQKDTRTRDQTTAARISKLHASIMDASPVLSIFCDLCILCRTTIKNHGLVKKSCRQGHSLQSSPFKAPAKPSLVYSPGNCKFPIKMRFSTHFWPRLHVYFPTQKKCVSPNSNVSRRSVHAKADVSRHSCSDGGSLVRNSVHPVKPLCARCVRRVR
jgi:hypothetical protein